MGIPPVLPDLSLLRRIGGGSYGDVWIARTITGVYRAVKVVDKARFSDDRPFLRELDGITRFQRSVGDQPRQLALMHVGQLEEKGIFYYVMELADDVEAGTDINPDTYQPLTLKALHEKRPILPAAEVIRIGSELARSLLGLHTAGLIHRDVKPSNIIFVAGVPKLADIGLVSSSDHTLTSLGTPGYSPPEGAGTMRADLYSLGKILYQLATGMHTDDFPKLPKHVEMRPDARALLELNEVFLKACQPDPGARYASAQEMLDELLLLHAGRSVKELNAARERLRALGRAALWLGAAAALVIAVLGVKNYFAVRALAAQEQQARIQSEKDERLARYTSDLNLAQLSLGSGDLGLARAALRRQIPAPGADDVRGLEWHALWNDTAGDDSRVLGQIHGMPLRGLALSHGDAVVGVEVGGDRSAVAWSLAAGSRRVLATGVRDVGGFSADGADVLIGRVDGSIAWVTLADGSLREISGMRGRVFFMSRDGRVVAVGEMRDGAVLIRLWRMDEPATEIAQWSAAEVAPGAVASAVALDGDGRSMALALFWPEGALRSRELRVVDVATGTVRFQRSDLGRWFSLRFSDDGALLAAGGADQPVTVLDATTGATARTFSGHAGEVLAVAFSADASQLYSAGEDQTIRLWSMREGVPGRTLRGHEAGISSLVRDAGGRIFSAGDDGTIRMWEEGVHRRAGLGDGFWSGALGDFLFVPDSERMLVTNAGGGVVALDDVTLEPAGEPLAAFHPLEVVAGRLRALDANLRLVEVDLQSGAVTPRELAPQSSERVAVIRVLPNRSKAALGFRDGAVEVWSLDEATSIRLEAVRKSPAWAVALSPDGRWVVSGHADGALRISDIVTGSPLRADEADAVAVRELVFATDGKTLFVGREDGRLCLLDPETLAVTREIRAHTRAINAVTLSASGDRLITGGADGFVAVWSYPELRSLTFLRRDRAEADASSYHGIYRVGLSIDGSRLVAMTEGGEILRWDLR